MRIEETSGWQDDLRPDKDRWFGDLVLDIAVDAEAITPVDTGELKQSIYAEVEGDIGTIGAKADYALYVHDGHRVAWRGADDEIHYNGEFVPGQPFLTPALYRRR
jgi:hypothetical protein